MDYWQCVSLHTREEKNRVRVRVSLTPQLFSISPSLPPLRARGFPFRESQPEWNVTGNLQLDLPILDTHWRARDMASCSIKRITQTERFI